MADPATQFQQAGLNVPYSFTPTHYTPQAVSIGPWAAQAYAGLGEQAQKTGQQLQNSALNPLVRAQAREGIARANAGVDFLDKLAKSPYGMAFGGEGPEGYYARAPVEAGSQWAPYVLPKVPEDKNAPAAPPTPPTAPHTAPQPKIGPSAEPPKTTTTTTDNTGLHGGKAESTVSPPPPKKSAFPDNIEDVSQTTPQRPYLSASADSGPIPTTATGEQGYTSEPAAPQGMPVTQRGPVWNAFAPSPLQPPAPPAPGQPPAQPPQQPQQVVSPEQLSQSAPPQPPTPGTVPGSLSDQYAQQQLAEWQGKTQTEPITADDAMSWIRRKTTLAKDATYLPHGGPGGEPAYAFHMRTPGGKGTGVNVVPISQMMQDGAAPTAASQNTSVVLSQSDKLKAQQQNALAAMPQAPADQDQAAAAQGPASAQDQPPPAPGGQQPYPTIASDQGGLQGAPVMEHAGTPQAYDPRAYQAELAAITQNPERLTASIDSSATPPATTTPGATRPDVRPLTKEQQAAVDGANIPQLEADAKNVPTLSGGGDPRVGDLGVLGPLYRDDSNGTGRLYARLPADNFRVAKYFLGSDGFKEYDLPDTKARQQFEAEYGTGQAGGAGGVKLSDNYTFPQYSHPEIENLPLDEIYRGLKSATQYHATHSTPPNDPKTQILNNLAEQSRSLQRQLDGMQAAKEANINPRWYDTTSMGQSGHAATRNNLVPVGGWAGSQSLLQVPFDQWPDQFKKEFLQAPDYFRAAGENLQAQGKDVMPLADYFNQEATHLVQTMAQLEKLPTLSYSTHPEGKEHSATLAGGYKGFYGSAKIELPSDISSINELNRAFQAGDQASAMAGLKRLKSMVDDQFQREYADGVLHGYRPNAGDVINHNAITKGFSLPDSPKLNPFRAPDGSVHNPYALTQPPSANPPSGPLPRLTDWNMAQRNKLVKKGGWYIGPDDKSYQRTD